MDVKTGLAACAIGLAAITPALAQTKPTPRAGSKQAIPEKQGKPLGSGRSESLSNKLDKTDGVIKPNGNVDPGMKAPAPTQPHTTPVIPPSATGGQNAK